MTRTEIEKGILAGQIKAGNSDKDLSDAGWEFAEVLEKELDYRTRKLEQIQNQNDRLHETLKFYQNPEKHNLIENIKYLEEQLEAKDDKIAELETEIEEFNSLIALQHKRSIEADKLWQMAHNKPNTWPDLGELLTWLMVERSKYKEQVTELSKGIDEIVAYPPEGHPRRTEDGYPSEFSYDEFAYKRVVDSVRNGLKELKEHALKDYDHKRSRRFAFAATGERVESDGSIQQRQLVGIEYGVSLEEAMGKFIFSFTERVPGYIISMLPVYKEIDPIGEDSDDRSDPDLEADQDSDSQ